MARWADWLLALWIVFVGVVYYGGALSPAIGSLTPRLATVYVLVLTVSVVCGALRLVRKFDKAQSDEF